MNPEVKVKWLAALRDGTRPQGKRYLLADGKYCCLGVLCELAAEGGVAEATTIVRSPDSWNPGMQVTRFDGDENSLPPSVQSWARVAEFGDSVSYTSDSLAARNDEGESFESIADWIEANL